MAAARSSRPSRPGFVGPPAAPRSISTARLYRIDIAGGRINFKQGDDKSALALIGVSGRVDQDAAGRWALDLEAQPMRAGVGLQQQIGTLRLRGNVAGTTARLQPAELSLTWLNVSLADALRLAASLTSEFGRAGGGRQGSNRPYHFQFERLCRRGRCAVVNFR